MNTVLPVLSADAVRAAESGFPRLLADGTLMLRAAHAVAAECFALFREHGRIVGRRVLLLVGSGDNGGDALFAGALMAARGVAVVALPLSEHVHTAGLDALLRAGGRLVSAAAAQEQMGHFDLVLDGIVGIGSTRPLTGDAAVIAQALAQTDVFTVAIDVPSGVHADTGAVDGVAVKADLTITFGALRRAHVLVPAALHCGEVLVSDIGIPMDSSDHAVTEQGDWFQVPAADADKYKRGVVGVVTGSANYAGAALLSVGSALHSGCGMVRYFGSARATVVMPHPEVVASEEHVLAAAHCQAWVVGCGIGTDAHAAKLLAATLLHDGPVVVDADAITLLAGSQDLRDLVHARTERGSLTMLTPHEGELRRLATGMSLNVDLRANRLAAAKVVAKSMQAVLLLKGPATIITDGTDFVATPLLGSQLATAGSGDVLAGLLGGAAARWSATEKLTTRRLMDLAAACTLRHAAAALPHDTIASDLLVGLEDANRQQ